MRKILVITLVLALSIGLCACGGKNDKKGNEATQEPTTTQIDVEQTVYSDTKVDVIYKGTDKDKIKVEFNNKSKHKLEACVSLCINNVTSIYDGSFGKFYYLKKNEKKVYEFLLKDFGKIGVNNKSDIKNMRISASAHDLKKDGTDNLIKMDGSYYIDCGNPAYKAQIKDDSKLVIDKKGVKAYLTDIKKVPKNQSPNGVDKSEYIFRVDNSLSDKIVQIRVIDGEINGKKVEFGMPLQASIDKNEILLDDMMKDINFKPSEVKTIKLKYYIYAYDNFSELSLGDSGKMIAKGTTDLIKWK